MPLFRKKPKLFSAEQWFPGKDVNGVYGTDRADCPFCWPGQILSKPHVHTIHDGQIVLIDPGDWIVPEPDSVHFYPIKDAIMRADFDEVG